MGKMYGHGPYHPYTPILWDVVITESTHIYDITYFDIFIREWTSFIDGIQFRSSEEELISHDSHTTQYRAHMSESSEADMVRLGFRESMCSCRLSYFAYTEVRKENVLEILHIHLLIIAKIDKNVHEYYM